MTRANKFFHGLIAALLLIFAQEAVAAPGVPRGIYALTTAGKPVPEALLARSDVAGIVVRSKWPDVEAAKGQYDFAYLEAQLDRVARAGKAASLVVTSGGRTTPDWVYRENVAAVSFVNDNAFQRGHGQNTVMPLFWDATFLDLKKSLIAAMGKRLSGHAALRLVSAQCANALTDDWHVPRGGDIWREHGFSEEKLVAACKDIIDATMAAFPQQAVRMAVGRVPGALTGDPDGAARELARYGAARYPGRFIVQRHNLSAKTPHRGADRPYGWDVLADNHPQIAAQFLWPAVDTRSCRLGGGDSPCAAEPMFSAAAEAALTYQPLYVEVYGADLEKEELAPAVTRFAAALENRPRMDRQRPFARKDRAGKRPQQDGIPPFVAKNLAGTVRHETFAGKKTGMDISYSIYLPPGYDAARDKRYPVIYWLHGKGGDEMRSTHVSAFLEKATTAGQIGEAIMVFPRGGEDSFYTDRPDGAWPVETMIIQDLIPRIDAEYRTRAAGPGGRLLMGFSMGGFGALKLAAKYPEMFSGVTAYGAPSLDSNLGMGMRDSSTYETVFGGDPKAFEMNTPSYLFRAGRDRVLRRGLVIRIVGGGEDGTRTSVARLHEVLGELGIPHEYEVLPGVKHVVRQYYESDKGRGFAALAKAP